MACLTLNFSGFLEKVKSGKAKVAGSGFGGKGLDRLDQERDAKEKAERKAYGEADEEKPAAAAATTTATDDSGKTQDDMTFGTFKVEVKRGPSSKEDRTEETLPVNLMAVLDFRLP